MFIFLSKYPFIPLGVELEVLLVRTWQITMPRGAVAVPTHKMHKIIFFINEMFTMYCVKKQNMNDQSKGISLATQAYWSDFVIRHADMTSVLPTGLVWAEEDFLTNEALRHS